MKQYITLYLSISLSCSNQKLYVTRGKTLASNCLHVAMFLGMVSYMSKWSTNKFDSALERTGLNLARYILLKTLFINVELFPHLRCKCTKLISMSFEKIIRCPSLEVPACISVPVFLENHIQHLSRARNETVPSFIRDYSAISWTLPARIHIKLKLGCSVPYVRTYVRGRYLILMEYVPASRDRAFSREQVRQQFHKQFSSKFSVDIIKKLIGFGRGKLSSRLTCKIPNIFRWTFGPGLKFGASISFMCWQHK